MTDTHTDIARRRRLIWIGIVVQAALAVLIAILRVVGADPRTVGEVLGSGALAVAALLPAVYAWLALDRRPGLLPAAAYGAIVVGLISTVLVPIALIATLLWARAHTLGISTVSPPRLAGLRRIGLAALVVVAIMSLFMHTDPACSETLADGTVRAVDPAEHGFTSGWGMGLGSVGSSTTTLGPDVVASSCSSDTVVAWEAAISLSASAAALGLASRWPVNQRQDPTAAEAPAGQ